MENILLVVGSCQDTIILNSNPEIPNTYYGYPIECWAPKGQLYAGAIQNVAGNIVEVEGIISDGWLVDSVPLGSLVIVRKPNSREFIRRYHAGVYDDMISNIMEEFSITDYKLPYLRARLFGSAAD